MTLHSRAFSVLLKTAAFVLCRVAYKNLTDVSQMLPAFIIGAIEILLPIASLNNHKMIINISIAESYFQRGAHSTAAFMISLTSNHRPFVVA